MKSIRTNLVTCFIGLICMTPYIARPDDSVLVIAGNQCAEVPEKGTQEVIVGTVLLGIAADFVGQLVKAGVDKAISYLKDDTSITKIGYFRVGSLSANDTNQPKAINPAITCITVAVGDVDEDAVANAKMPQGGALKPSTLVMLRDKGMVGLPKLYLEAQFYQVGDDGPLYFRPKMIYYGEHLKSGGLFGNHRRDLGITIDFLGIGQPTPFFSNTISFSNVSTGTLKKKLENYGTPWTGTFSDANKGPFTIRATVVETGKANTFDAALAQALSDSESAIVKASNSWGASSPAATAPAAGASGSAAASAPVAASAGKGK